MKNIHRIIALLMLLLITAAAGCDPKGDLSEAETQKLFDEIQPLVTSGELWTYKMSREGGSWSSEEQKNSDFELIKAAAEDAFDPANHFETDGIWWSSKSYCRICRIFIDKAFTYNGAERTVTYIEAIKNRNGSIRLDVTFADADRVGIRFTP